jgi:hypothetical protein
VSHAGKVTGGSGALLLRLLTLLAAAPLACKAGPPRSDATAIPADGTVEVPPDAPPALRVSNVPPAALAGEPPGDLLITAAACGGQREVELDTQAGTIAGCTGGQRQARVAQSDGSAMALVVARTITVERGMVVRVRGTLPLVLVALDSVTVDGTVNAAALGETGGPGGASARPEGKGAGVGPGAGTGDRPGGGGGGSHCGRGGSGGPDHLGGPGNAGGTRYLAGVIPLAGGSSGGNGATWPGGGGGGAIQLAAGRKIVIGPGGVIHAGGGGGEREGGGGGSGGAILLEAPVVEMAGVLAANGGGGGSGGNFGSDATPDAEAALGGAAVRLNTGEGGAGAAGTVADGADGNPNPTFVNGDYSGGGGGGAGYIRIQAATSMVTGILSPAPGSGCATMGPPG